MTALWVKMFSVFVVFGLCSPTALAYVHSSWKSFKGDKFFRLVWWEEALRHGRIHMFAPRLQ